MLSNIECQSTLRFTDAINLAYVRAMQEDPKVLCYGLGVTDPKHIFNTTTGLQERFGEDRVFEMPTSENAMTGVGVGLALNGYRPIMVHQRLDFFLLAMDQLVNSASKWFHMSAGERPVPITIRLILGRGWGQGSTHSQALHSWFNHIPGLKVVMPSLPDTAEQLFYSAIMDNNPVVFLEHRWLHNLKYDATKKTGNVPLGIARVVRSGKDITVVSASHMTIEAIKAIESLGKSGVSCEHIDLQTIKPLDIKTIERSVRKTGRLLVLDTSYETGSVAHDIIAKISKTCFQSLKCAPASISLPDHNVPVSHSLVEHYYPTSNTISNEIRKIFKLDSIRPVTICKKPDVPDLEFVGPF